MGLPDASDYAEYSVEQTAGILCDAFMRRGIVNSA